MNTQSPHSTATSDLDPATYNAFVDALELSDVEIVKLHAERTSEGTVARTEFDLGASYMQDGEAIRYRYDLAAYLSDDEGAVLGHVTASAVVVTRTTGALDAVCIERFGATSGALIAHPYLREAIGSSAQRIGFPGVLLPAIRRQPDGDGAD